MVRWKRAEQKLARLFGTRRRPLSGSNQGGGSDDAMHNTLYLECKSKKKQSLFTLYRETRVKALKEKKIPIIGLVEKNSPGVLLVIHSKDLETLLEEYQKAKEQTTDN